MGFSPSLSMFLSLKYRIILEAILNWVFSEYFENKRDWLLFVYWSTYFEIGCGFIFFVINYVVVSLSACWR